MYDLIKEAIVDDDAAIELSKMDKNVVEVVDAISELSLEDTMKLGMKFKRFPLGCDLTEAVVGTCASDLELMELLGNLIDNAFKFSNADSVITIETTLRNGKVFVSVKDRGIGIPKDSIGRIWERFYKTDASRGKDKKGTGLGLSIVKEIIQAHGENINVVSTQGVGTEFTFTLPCSKNKK